jgi:20S proteasome alpha/beta subunit
VTVCIAALCRADDGEPRAIVATDRMVTAGDFLEFEHSGSKMVQLTDKAAVMVAGNTLDGMRLVNEAAADDLPEHIVAIATTLGERYGAARLERAEQAALTPHGLSLDSFHGMHRGLNEQVVMLLENQLSQFNLGVELLLAGVDDSGAHIYTNGNPGGGNTNHDPIGWAAIGIGAPHVLSTMAGYVHSATADYKQTLFRVYAAKRGAEVAPGVGRETEMAVISNEGLERLSSDDLERLALIFDGFRSITGLELQKQLDAFHPEGGPDGADGNTE